METLRRLIGYRAPSAGWSGNDKSVWDAEPICQLPQRVDALRRNVVTEGSVRLKPFVMSEIVNRESALLLRVPLDNHIMVTGRNTREHDTIWNRMPLGIMGSGRTRVALNPLDRIFRRGWSAIAGLRQISCASRRSDAAEQYADAS